MTKQTMNSATPSASGSGADVADADLRILPRNIEAERQLIATVLQDGRKALDYLGPDTLTPEHFYRVAHQDAWRAVLAAYRRTTAYGDPMPVDVLTVSDELHRVGADQNTRWTVSELATLPVLEGIRQHAWQVIATKQLRDLYDVAKGLAGDTYHVAAAPADLARHYREILADIDDDVAELARRWSGASATHQDLLRLADLRSLPKLEPLVAGRMVRGTEVVFVGDSDAGKSYYAQTLGFRLVSEGLRVAYIAAEGGQGILLRMEAYLAAHGLPDDVLDNFCVVPHAVQLYADGGAQWRAWCQSFAGSDWQPDLVIVDTIGRCIDGADENSNSAMHCVAKAAETLRLTLGSDRTFLGIHHVPRGGTTPRGATCIKNDADTVWLFERDEQGDRSQARPTHTRDGWAFAPFAYRLHWVSLPIYGAQAGAYVVADESASEPRQDGPALSGREQQIFDIFLALLHEYAYTSDGVFWSSWRDRCAEGGIPEGSFKPIVPRLVKKGKVERRDERNVFWPVDPALMPAPVPADAA